MLSECSSNSIRNHDCSHNEDAGVRCLHSKYEYNIVPLPTCIFSNYFQSQSARMEVFIWWMALDLMKADWRFVEREYGGQYVMIIGTLLMLKFCVNN